MALPPPPPNFVIDTPSASQALGGRPVIRKGTDPQPKVLNSGRVVDLNTGTATPVVGLPQEHWRPLAPSDKLYLPNHPGITNEQTGEIRYGPEGPTEDAKNAAMAGDPFQNDVLLKQIAHVRELAQKPFSLGAGSGYLSYVPIIGQNAADMRAALQQVQGDLIQKGVARLRELNGGKGAATLANTEKEGERIASSFAALSPDQSPQEFLKGLDDAEAFYRRAVTQTQANPAAAVGPQADASAPEAQLTRSNTLPPTGVDDSGVQTSAKFKTIVDPKAQKLAGRILGLVNQGASRNQVMGFAVGADPSLRNDQVFRDWVDGALRLKAKDPRSTFTVSPEFYTKRVPLDAKGVVPGTSFLSEQDRAKAAASKPGAVVSGMADTASLGASRDLAGLIDAATGGSFGEGRKDFRRQAEPDRIRASGRDLRRQCARRARHSADERSGDLPAPCRAVGRARRALRRIVG
jgi:hypothetical protein